MPADLTVWAVVCKTGKTHASPHSPIWTRDDRPWDEFEIQTADRYRCGPHRVAELKEQADVRR